MGFLPPDMGPRALSSMKGTSSAQSQARALVTFSFRFLVNNAAQFLLSFLRLELPPEERE